MISRILFLIQVLEEYKKLEEVKKEVKRERLKAGLGNPEEDDGAQR